MKAKPDEEIKRTFEELEILEDLAAKKAESKVVKEKSNFTTSTEVENIITKSDALAVELLAGRFTSAENGKNPNSGGKTVIFCIEEMISGKYNLDHHGLAAFADDNVGALGVNAADDLANHEIA
jgi:hypothetical protein